MGLFARLWGAGRAADSPDLAAAVARAVDLVEPRLRQISGFPDRYQHAAAHALAYARELAGRLPGPVHVSREAYASDPLVHALFATPAEIHTALCVSQSMRDYRRDHPDAGDVYALICMRRGTKAMLGMELSGEVLRRDVPQQAVYFTDHTVADTGPSEARAREQIAWGLFDSLAKHVRLRVDARRRKKDALEQERDEWLVRLHGADRARRGELETGLQQALHRLGALTESLELHRLADDFDAVLGVPERYVYVERTRLTLDSMGLLNGSSGHGAEEIEFCDLIGRDRRRWTVAVMYCDRVMEEAAEGDRFMLAQRWLGL